MAVDYSMRISRLTVDKLGVKLYDKVSAVIAELIANAYDADSTEVSVCAPMGQFLATRAGGAVADKGFDVQVVDNGIGMTPQQVQDFFLVVGAERRNDPNRGEVSPRFNRRVMGRKGVGKTGPVRHLQDHRSHQRRRRADLCGRRRPHPLRLPYISHHSRLRRHRGARQRTRRAL